MRSSLVRMRSSQVRMRSSLVRMRSSLVRMRSSLVVRASDCQCTSCNGPGFDPSIRRHSGIWGAADETVLNNVRTKKIKNPPKKYFKKNFWRVFMRQSMKTRCSPRDSGFEEVWPPSSLDSNRKDNFLRGVSKRDVTDPLTTRCSSWSPPSRRCWSTSPGRTSRGPTAGSGRGWRRPWLLWIIYSAKCQVYMKRNKYAKFYNAVIL